MFLPQQVRLEIQSYFCNILLLFVSRLFQSPGVWHSGEEGWCLFRFTTLLLFSAETRTMKSLTAHIYWGIVPSAAAAKSLQSCPTLCNPIDGSLPGSPVPGIKNTGVGCHFLLQCMKVKSESEIAQSCPTLNNPMDFSLPGSSIHGICQARVLEWVATAFSEALLNTQKYPKLCISWHRPS